MKPWNAIRNQIPKRKTSGDVWIHFHTSPDDFSSQKLSPLCNFLYEYICNKAPHLHVFSLIFTHFKWSELGLKQNCEASLSPINQDFLESCQYIAVADEEYFYHCYIPSLNYIFCSSTFFLQLLTFHFSIIINTEKNCSTIVIEKALTVFKKVLVIFSLNSNILVSRIVIDLLTTLMVILYS